MENTIKQNNFYESFIKPNLPKSKKEWVSYIIVILVIVTLGLIAMNQYLAISYKATLLQNPCELCKTFEGYVCSGRNFGIKDLDLSNLTIAP